jgi:hypothetical protein
MSKRGERMKQFQLSVQDGVSAARTFVLTVTGFAHSPEQCQEQTPDNNEDHRKFPKAAKDLVTY